MFESRASSAVTMCPSPHTPAMGHGKGTPLVRTHPFSFRSPVPTTPELRSHGSRLVWCTEFVIQSRVCIVLRPQTACLSKCYFSHHVTPLNMLQLFIFIHIITISFISWSHYVLYIHATYSNCAVAMCVS